MLTIIKLKKVTWPHFISYLIHRLWSRNNSPEATLQLSYTYKIVSVYRGFATGNCLKDDNLKLRLSRVNIRKFCYPDLVICSSKQMARRAMYENFANNIATDEVSCLIWTSYGRRQTTWYRIAVNLHHLLLGTWLPLTKHPFRG